MKDRMSKARVLEILTLMINTNSITNASIFILDNDSGNTKRFLKSIMYYLRNKSEVAEG